MEMINLNVSSFSCFLLLYIFLKYCNKQKRRLFPGILCTTTLLNDNLFQGIINKTYYIKILLTKKLKFVFFRRK